MSVADLRNIISGCCNDVIFTYNGQLSGITAVVVEYVPTFQVWHGSSTKEYKDINTLITDKFFSGKSINDLAGKIKFTIA